MADRLTKCVACNGRGYHNCECWPGDCICGFGDETCDECGGDGLTDPSYDDFAPAIDAPSPALREDTQ